jgi:hypothetical protein
VLLRQEAEIELHIQPRVFLLPILAVPLLRNQAFIRDGRAVARESSPKNLHQ